MKEKLSQILADLTAIPSISSSHQNCARAIDYVEGFFRSSDLEIQRFESSRVQSICISRKKSLSFDILFLGHLDVVPAPQKCFSPQIDGDWFFARGAIDMKGQCAVMMELLLQHADDPAFENCALLLTTDEEVGGKHGAGHLVTEHGLKARIVFNPDGGGSFKPCISEKGLFHIELKAEGIACHGSRPWEGKNAIDMLLADVGRLRSCFDYAQSEEEEKVSISLGQIEGGYVVNQVPSFAKALIDFRYPPGLDPEKLKTSLFSCINNSTIEIIEEGSAILIDENSDGLKLLFQALDFHGYPPEVVKACGSSDSRWFVSDKTDILMIKPIGSGFHDDSEKVSLSSLVRLYEVMETFVALRNKDRA